MGDVFIDIGDCALEFLMDCDPSLALKDRLGEDKGNTKGDQSAIAKFVARRAPVWPMPPLRPGISMPSRRMAMSWAPP